MSVIVCVNQLFTLFGKYINTDMDEACIRLLVWLQYS